MAKGDVDKEKKFFESKIFAILSYLSILCIIPLIFKRDNEFVLSHGKQGLVIFVAQVGVFILSIIFPWIFKIGIFILLFLSFIGIVAALQGRQIEFPIISQIANNL